MLVSKVYKTFQLLSTRVHISKVRFVNRERSVQHDVVGSLCQSMFFCI